LERVAACGRVRLFLHAAEADGIFHAAHDQFRVGGLNETVPEFNRFRAVGTGIDVEQRKRNPPWCERPVGQVRQHHRIFPTREHENRTLAVRGDLPNHDDGLGFQPREMTE
jgi:hypothetical protein